LRIDFRKITNQPKNFQLSKDLVKFYGHFSKIKRNLVKIDADLQGRVPLICSRCGNEFEKDLKQKLEILVSDGIINHHELKNLDIIEMENCIDFDYIFESEIESIKSEINFCNNCKDLETVEFEF